MEQVHLGSGIMLFRNALDLSEHEIYKYLKRLTEFTDPQGYSKKDWTDKRVSDGGYEFDEKELNINPSRYVNTLFESITDEEKLVIQSLEDSFYKCLISYCRVFPVAMRDVKWRTRGYVIHYSEGQYIGPHSDTSIPYKGDSLESDSTHPMQNTLTGSICLNSDFTGGKIVFRNWGISVDQSFGDVLIYPSSFIGCHEVKPIRSGERYAYLCWFGHGQTSMIQPLDSTDQGLHMPVKRLNSLAGDVGQEFIEQKQVLVGPVNQEKFTSSQSGIQRS